ncbi:MAG: T9SS type A sorting domain-containing protein [Bacteroidota bacterium]
MLLCLWSIGGLSLMIGQLYAQIPEKTTKRYADQLKGRDAISVLDQLQIITGGLPGEFGDVDPQSAATTPPPSNDECILATPIAIDGGNFVFSNAGAGTHSADPSPANWTQCPDGNEVNSVWFRFTIDGSVRNVSISTLGSEFNPEVEKPMVAVFSGTCGALQEVGSETFSSKRLNLDNLADGTYYIMVDGVCSQNGIYKIRIDATPTGSPSLWYPVATLPKLNAGFPLKTSGQWGTYAAPGEPSTSCANDLQFSDWYQFEYNPVQMSGLHVSDHDQESAFILSIYDQNGNEVSCNRWGNTVGAPSFTWDVSAQTGKPVHAPNIAFAGLGMNPGDNYYVRVSSNAPTRFNASDAGDTYTIMLGHYLPDADNGHQAKEIVLTQRPTLNYLNGQSNLRAAQSSELEMEGLAAGFPIENSLIYKFNTGLHGTVDIILRNITYYSYEPSAAKAEIAVQSAHNGGTVLHSTVDFDEGTFMTNLTALEANTDYYILIDGGGAFGGTQLSFDISVSTPEDLPVTLTRYDGWLEEDRVHLQWETVSESNNDYFLLERSADNQNFTPLAQIDGQQFSNSAIVYDFFDEAPLSGANHYRLWQIDLDGARTNLGTIEVLLPLDESTFDIVSIAPVPTATTAKVEVLAGSAGLLQYQVLDLRGKQVMQGTQDLTIGSNILSLDLSAQPTGVYMIALQQGHSRRTAKVIKH